MSKTILVTGGCGFIGKALVKKLVEKKHKIIVVDKSSKRHYQLPKKITFIKGNVASKAVWGKIPKADYLFHLGSPASVILFNEQLDLAVKTTINGLINAFEWAKKNKVKKLIYPSSGSIFGKSTNFCTEKTLPQPINTYGKTKLACEYIAKIYESVVPSLGLRIFAGYGPQEDHKGQIASVVTLTLNDMLKNKSPIIFGDGQQTRDFIYIDDIVDTMIKVMNRKLTGVLNIGSGENTSFNKLVTEINLLLGKNIKPRYVAKPKTYLQKTSCRPTLLLKILNRQPLTLKQGLEKYLRAIEKK